MAKYAPLWIELFVVCNIWDRKLKISMIQNKLSLRMISQEDGNFKITSYTQMIVLYYWLWYLGHVTLWRACDTLHCTGILTVKMHKILQKLVQ